jgi:hypothetical protein
LIAGILGVLAGLAVAVTSNRWPGSSKRYQAVRFAPADPESDLPVQHSADHRPPPENARDAAIDTWDDLSRGDDPTR